MPLKATRIGLPSTIEPGDDNSYQCFLIYVDLGERHILRSTLQPIVFELTTRTACSPFIRRRIINIRVKV